MRTQVPPVRLTVPCPGVPLRRHNTVFDAKRLIGMRYSGGWVQAKASLPTAKASSLPCRARHMHWTR